MDTKYVLIETYWNVKISSMIRKNIAKIVLIETYWNVKGNAVKMVVVVHRY